MRNLFIASLVILVLVTFTVSVFASAPANTWGKTYRMTTPIPGAGYNDITISSDGLTASIQQFNALGDPVGDPVIFTWVEHPRPGLWRHILPDGTFMEFKLPLAAGTIAVGGTCGFTFNQKFATAYVPWPVLTRVS